MIIKPVVLKLGPFQQLHEGLMDEKFPWYYHPHQVSKTDRSYFYHTFYWSHNIQSDYFNLITSLIEFLKPVALINIRANLMINRDKEIKSDWHMDEYNNPKLNHKTAVYYVNSNNGYTEFKLKRKIKKVPSVANSMAMFDSSTQHRAVSQTKEDRRIVININYF